MAQQRNSYKITTRSLFATLCIVSFIIVGCTNDESSIGSKFIPENERMQVKVDTTYNIDAYTQLNDTIHTDNFSVGLIGAMTNPFLGSTYATFGSEIYPKSINNSLHDSAIYYEPIVDSVYFSFNVSNYIGQKGRSMKVKIYRLINPMKVDNLRSDYDFTNQYGDLLADITVTGTGLYKTKELTDAAKLFGERLIKSSKLEFDSAKAFRAKCQGIYFFVDPSEDMGTFYKIDASTVNIIVKYHLDKEPRKGTKGDAYFGFINYESVTSGDTTKGKSHRVISIVHDRSSAAVNLKPVELNSDTLFYASSMGGAMGVIDLSRYLKSSADGKSVNWRDSVPCIISRAELVVECYKSGNTEMDRIPSKLGLFQQNARNKLVPIIDLYLESSIASMAGSYNGLFQKGRLHYSANITAYFQSLIEKPATPSRLYLLPAQSAVNENTVFYSDYSYGVFRGTGNTSPIKLIITYSKLKK